MKSMKLVVEGFVVLISILLAFYLEGWRDDQELDREVKQELYSVKEELEINQKILQAEIQNIDRIISGNKTLLGMLYNDLNSTSLSVPDTFGLLANVWAPTFDPSLGAIEALITSGRLAKVKNSQLRIGLAGLKYKFNDALEEEIIARELTFNQQFPLVKDHLNLGEILPINDVIFGLDKSGFAPQVRASGQSLPTFGNISYPNSFAIRNILELKIGYLNVGRLEFARILPHINDLIELVDEEIDGKN